MPEKLYPDPISIEVRPFPGFRAKWVAETEWINRPYKDSYGSGEKVKAYAKTAAQATEKVKDKLCKITAREEKKHVENQEWKAGFKTTTFTSDQDCNGCVPRPKLFEDHT